MIALIGALVAGILTTLAPCVLPLLPVIVGGSIASDARLSGTRRAFVVAVGLGLSVVAFTLLLKASTVLIDVPVEVWRWLSGGLLIALGLVSLFPQAWEAASRTLRLQSRTSSALASARQGSGATGALLTGAVLGPVFSSCSPLYGYVVVTALPAQPTWGMALLLAYVAGLCGTLLGVAVLGQKAIAKLGWAADSHSWLRRGLGALFVLVGLFIVTGWDHALQTWIIQNSPIAPWALDSLFVPA